MTKGQVANSIAYCGLLCFLCQPADVCGCRTNNHCGKRLSPEGCFQYNCCVSRGLNGCWECSEALCGKDMLALGKTKMRAFITCIREDGINRFSEYIARNAGNGVVYHRDGIWGDYDLASEEDVLKLLRTGSVQ